MTPEGPYPYDGGPAFPLEYKADGATVTCWGMSLRDWFAGRAIAGLSTKNYAEELMVAMAYDIADRMLKEREKIRHET